MKNIRILVLLINVIFLFNNGHDGSFVTVNKFKAEDTLLNKLRNFALMRKPKFHRFVKSNIPGLAQYLPIEFYLLIQELKNLPPTSDNKIIPNRLLFYGPPGNGKSTLAQKLAELTGSHLIQVKGTTIVGRFMGQGPETVEKKFEEAETIHKKTGKRVVLFIDEIDAIANMRCLETSTYQEHSNATQTLWLNLDKLAKGKNHIFVILATNRYKDLNPALTDRFPAESTIEIPNPNKKIREDIIRFYNKEFNVNLTEKLIKKLVKKTDKLSIRAIESILVSAKRRSLLQGIQVTDGLLSEIVEIHQSKTKYSDVADNNNLKSNSFDLWLERICKISSLYPIAKSAIEYIGILDKEPRPNKLDFWNDRINRNLALMTTVASIGTAITFKSVIMTSKVAATTKAILLFVGKHIQGFIKERIWSGVEFPKGF